MTIVGIAILLAPVLIRTWKEFRTARSMEYGLDKRSNALKIFNTTFIIVWLLVACFPFIWTFWGSFKVRADFF